MEVVAKAKYVRRAPRKARLVADAVIGLRVSEALAQLEFSPRHAAIDVAKVIKSAAANAEHNYNLNRDDLVVKQLLVDEGPTMKRFRPVSRGMAHQYFHRTSHITAVVEDRPAPPPAPRAQRRRRRDEPADAKPKAEAKAEVVEEKAQTPPSSADAADTSPPSGEEAIATEQTPPASAEAEDTAAPSGEEAISTEEEST